MSEVYLKKAKKTPETGTSETRKIVERMLSEIEIGKETIAKKYASDLDGFNGDIIVSQESIENASKMVPEKLKDDIKFAHERIKKFAEAQKQSIRLPCYYANIVFFHWIRYEMECAITGTTLEFRIIIEATFTLIIAI